MKFIETIIQKATGISTVLPEIVYCVSCLFVIVATICFIFFVVVKIIKSVETIDEKDLFSDNDWNTK